MFELMIIDDDSPLLNKCPECGCELRHHNNYELKVCAYIFNKTSKDNLSEVEKN